MLPQCSLAFKCDAVTIPHSDVEVPGPPPLFVRLLWGNLEKSGDEMDCYKGFAQSR